VKKEEYRMSSVFHILTLEIDSHASLTPVKLSKKLFSPDKLIAIIDEELGRVWLWLGSKRRRVEKIKARQVASFLKTYGYTYDKNTIGGAKTKMQLIEIDESKILEGDSEEAKKKNELMKRIEGLPEKILIKLGETVEETTTATEAIPEKKIEVSEGKMTLAKGIAILKVLELVKTAYIEANDKIRIETPDGKKYIIETAENKIIIKAPTESEQEKILEEVNRYIG